VVKLRYAFGSAYPLLANQTSEVLDPLDYWWALTWSPLLDLDIITQEQEQKLYVDFQKVQYSVLLSSVPPLVQDSCMFCLRILARMCDSMKNRL